MAPKQGAFGCTIAEGNVVEVDAGTCAQYQTISLAHNAVLHKDVLCTLAMAVALHAYRIVPVGNVSTRDVHIFRKDVETISIRCLVEGRRAHTDIPNGVMRTPKNRMVGRGIEKGKALQNDIGCLVELQHHWTVWRLTTTRPPLRARSIDGPMASDRDVRQVLSLYHAVPLRVLIPRTSGACLEHPRTLR